MSDASQTLGHVACGPFPAGVAPQSLPVIDGALRLNDLAEHPDLARILQRGAGLAHDGQTHAYVAPTELVRALTGALRQAETERDMARRALAEAAGSRGRFFANLSHELKTPLSAIVGYSDLIRAQVFGPITPSRYQDYVEAMHSSSLHLVDLVDAVLDMARLQSDEVQLKEVPVAIAPLADEVLRVVSPLAEQRGIRLRTRIAHNLPELWADARVMRQVLINLTSNAIKFSSEGREVTPDPP
jgi:signal transduction histidine kinase